MGVRSWFGKHFLEDVKISSNQTVIIEVPAALYYKELAIYTACSYLALKEIFEKSIRIQKL